MPELPDPSLAWEDLSAVDRRALTEMLVDKIVIAPHLHKIDENGRRHYLIRAIPYQDPQQEGERLKAVHEAGSRSSPGSEQRRRRHTVLPVERGRGSGRATGKKRRSKMLRSALGFLQRVRDLESAAVPATDPDGRCRDATVPTRLSAISPRPTLPFPAARPPR